MKNKFVLDTMNKDELPTELDSAITKFNRFFGVLEGLNFERESLITKLKLALMTREHVLIEGQPGTGKSYIAHAIFNHVKGSKVFSLQLSQFLSEDHLIGPVNPKVLREKGIIEHNTENTIVDCNFAHLDEIFDASDNLLRGRLLGILNERIFLNGNQKVDCPLHTAVLTTNFNKGNNLALEAVYDRIIFKDKISYLKERKNISKMMNSYMEGIPRFDKLADIRLTLQDITTIANFSSIFKDAIIDSDIIDCFLNIKSEFCRVSKFDLSDRTLNKCLLVIKAFALLNGRFHVDISDLNVLEYCWIPDAESPNRIKLMEIISKEIGHLSSNAKVKTWIKGIEQELKEMKVGDNLKVKELNKLTARLIALESELDSKIESKEAVANENLKEMYEDVRQEVCKKRAEVGSYLEI